MKRVWIAQCLCPDRHCIMANAGEANSAGEAAALVGQLREAIDKGVASKWMNPWCALCHAEMSTWTYETGRTRFGSMILAMSALKQSEADQRRVNDLFGDLERDD